MLDSRLDSLRYSKRISKWIYKDMKIYSEFSKFDKNLDEYTERMMNRQKTEQKIESSDEKNANSCFIHFDSNDPEMMIVKKSKTEEKGDTNEICISD